MLTGGTEKSPEKVTAKAVLKENDGEVRDTP